MPRISAAEIKAKIDTGARTSALHALDLRIDDGDDGPVAAFEVHPHQRSRADATAVTHPVHEFRDVRSSTGHLERRPVIVTPVVLGAATFDLELTLTGRDQMGFRMLLGRVALRRRFLVDPGRSYLVGHPQVSTAGAPAPGVASLRQDGLPSS